MTATESVRYVDKFVGSYELRIKEPDEDWQLISTTLKRTSKAIYR